MNRDSRPESAAAGQQDGAVAVIAAVVIAFVAITLLAFSTDIGSLWQSQRALVTDTDAAALAGAIELAEDWMTTDACSQDVATTEARRLLQLNDPEADDFDIVTTANCEIESDAFIGQVQMTASQQSPGFISGQDLSARGTTTATFQLLYGEAQGLAVCRNLFDGDEPKSEFVLDTNYLLFPYKFAEKTLNEYESVGSCEVTPSNGGAPFTAGGWGWVTAPCDLDEDGPLCPAETGTDDLKKELGDLEDQTIDFPIFERAQDVGSNAKYLLVGRVEAKLVGTCGSGDGPFDPAVDCNLNALGKIQGQPGFVVVTDWDVQFFSESTARKFRDARYSICDVDGSGDYCP